MAISDPVALTSALSTANTTTYDSTITASLSVDDVVLITVYNVKGTAADKAALSKIAGTCTIGAFTEITDVTQTDTDFYRITSFWCKVTGAGTLQVRATFSAGQTGCHIVVEPLRGTDLTNPIRSVSGTPQTITATGSASKPATTLPAAALSTSWVIHASSVRRNPAAWGNSEAGWIEDVDSGLATPAHGLWYGHKESGDDTFAADSGTNAVWRALSFEVQEPAGTNGVASPATVAAVAAVPAPTTQGAGVASPSTVAAIGAVPAAAASAGIIASPATVAAVAAVPSPTVRGAASVSPSTVAAIAAVPASTARGAAVVSPATVAGVAAVPAPTVRGAAVASPSVVAALAAVPAPTARGNASVSPAVVAALAAVPAPVVRGGAIVSPAVVAAIAAVPAAVVTGGSGGTDGTATVATVVAVAAVPAPTVRGGAQASPATVVAVAAVPAPSVAGAARAVVGVVAALAAVPPPSVQGSAVANPVMVAALAAVPTPSVFSALDGLASPLTVVTFALVPAPFVIGTQPGEEPGEAAIGDLLVGVAVIGSQRASYPDGAFGSDLASGARIGAVKVGAASIGDQRV